MQTGDSFPASVCFEGVTKEFSGDWTRRKTRALVDFSLVVPRGSIVALVGTNGSGKTTALKLAAGLTRPTRGSCRVTGRVGYLPESPVLPEFTTARLLLEMVLLADGRVSREEVERVLALVGLTELADVRLAQLSKGMRQRASLAIALAGSPDVLLLDEPTDGLDPRALQSFAAILAAERAAGRTVIFSTHYLAAIEQLADRVVMLDSGRATFIGDAAEVEARGGVSRIFLENTAR